MTTRAAEAAYLALHLAEWADKGYAVYNPHGKDVADLPVIYGFCKSGSPGYYGMHLLAEDGTHLGDHVCSAEGYGPHDLGVIEGSRPDRHETFRAHYPDGYRMEYVPLDQVRARSHAGREAAFQRNQEAARRAATQTEGDDAE